MAGTARKTWSTAALAFAAGACVLDWVSKHYAGRAMMTMARSAAERTSALMHPLVVSYARRSDALRGAGLILALVALVCGVMAGYGGPDLIRRWLLVCLLALYLLSFLLLV